MTPEASPYRRTFVRLLGFLKPYRVSLVVSILLAVGSQAAQIAWSGSRGGSWTRRSSRVTPTRSGSSIAAIVALGVLKASLMVGRRLISGRQALGVEMDMRNGLYARLVRLSFGFYDRHQTGQLMSRATVDLQGVRFFLGYGLIFFFQNVLVVLSVTAVLFFVEWELALIALAIVPLLIVLAYRYSHVAHPTLREVQQKLADVATVAQENIVGVHVVKAFAQEPAEQDKFRVRSEAVFRQTLHGEPPARALRAADLVRADARAGGRAALRARRWSRTGASRWAPSSPSTSTSECSSCRFGRSACGSARPSARPRPASGSSR